MIGDANDDANGRLSTTLLLLLLLLNLVAVVIAAAAAAHHHEHNPSRPVYRSSKKYRLVLFDVEIGDHTDYFHLPLLMTLCD